jgi:hypothetical protein
MIRWSLDFVSDQFIDGRRMRSLVVVDDCTAGDRRGSNAKHSRGACGFERVSKYKLLSMPSAECL